jgi:hypothetical protein
MLQLDQRQAGSGLTIGEVVHEIAVLGHHSTRLKKLVDRYRKH